jgi:mRNA interferase MazF
MAGRIAHPLRGEIWLVNFDPSLGSEINKTRPALIVQNDLGNRASAVTIVAAITATVKRAYPFQVSIPAGESGLRQDSVVTLNHVRSVDRQRLVQRLGKVSNETMRAVESAILVTFGISSPK